MAQARGMAVDATGEIVTPLATVSGQEAVRQNIRIRVRFMLGECYLDDSRGTSWLDLIFVRGTPDVVIREELRARIASVPDVTDVVALSFTRNRSTRVAGVSFAVRTIYSQEPIQGIVEITAP